MAHSDKETVISGVAGTTVAQFRFVALQTDGKYDPVTTATYTDGINVSDDATDGEAIAIAVPNGAIVMVEAGEAITVGAAIRAGTGGKAFVADTTNDVIVGRAVEAASGDGSIIGIQYVGYRGLAA